jgi:hypothetical protein
MTVAYGDWARSILGVHEIERSKIKRLSILRSPE